MARFRCSKYDVFPLNGVSVFPLSLWIISALSCFVIHFILALQSLVHYSHIINGRECLVLHEIWRTENCFLCYMKIFQWVHPSTTSCKSNKNARNCARSSRTMRKPNWIQGMFLRANNFMTLLLRFINCYAMSCTKSLLYVYERNEICI